MLSPQLLVVLCLFFFYKETYSIICYHCDGLESSNVTCSEGTNCTGKACVLYERPDGALTSTFCVYELPKLLDQKGKLDRECWLEPDGKGRHCMCGEDFCNKPRSRKEINDDPETLPLQNATLLKKNPLIDYDDVWDEEDNGMNAKPPPANILFPSAADIDPRTAGEDSKTTDIEDEDLVPIEHENYEYEDEKSRKQQLDKQQEAEPIQDKKTFHHHRRANSEEKLQDPNRGRIHAPPVLLLFFSSAAAIARLFS